MYKWSIHTYHKLLIVLKISFILVIYWDKKSLSCYFTIWTQQLKNQIFFIKSFMEVPLYMGIDSFKYWTAIYLIWFFLTGYWYRNIIKAKKRLKKQVCIALRQKTRNLFLMVPHWNWLWTVTTDPVWHFPHQNVTKYIKVSCYSFNMNIMQYFGKYSPCTRCTCTEGIEI